MFRNRTLWAVVILSMLVQSGVVFGRMSDEKLREMQERADKEGWTFTVGRNAATESSWDVLCGALPPDPNDPLIRAKLDELAQREKMGVMEGLPDWLDYRDPEYGSIVPPVRHQGNCGSCWAHSAVGVVESAILLDMYRRELNFNADEMDLSEQWLISCTEAGNCNGGYAYEAFYAMKWDSFLGARDNCYDEGAVLEEDFPYTASDITPCGCPYRHPYGIEGWHYAGSGTEQLKQAIYEYGPISTRVTVYDSFFAYTGGIYNADPSGNPICDHSVILVGWDDHPPEQPEGPGVWILRNSWGTDWGEEGYMRITYDSYADIRVFEMYVEYVWDKDPLEGHWKFDKGSGTTAYDSAGDNDGTLGEAPEDPDWLDDPVRGWCLDFDGDDYVELPEAVIIRDEYEKSICAWIYVDSWHDYATILRWYDGRNVTMAGFYSEGRIGGVLDSKYRLFPTVTVDAVCPTDEWHHVCYTYDGLTTSIYVDGHKQATSEVWDWSLPSQGAYIGRDSFEGLIDDVHVYNWALDIDEIWDAMFGELTRFRIKNSSDETVAWFGNLGNLWLKGNFTSGGTCTTPAGSFIIANSTDETVAYIDNEGNMCIEGDWSELCGSCNPEGDAFIIRNSSDANVAYIDFANGYLCLTGKLYWNPEP